MTFRAGIKGSYFALVTLAFAEVLRILASVAPITGAGVGTLVKLDLRVEALQFESRAVFYWVILALVAISLLVAQRLERTRFGTWLIAVRENEDAAKALGVNATLIKLGAMVNLRRDHRGGGLLLHPVFPVRRFRHRLRHAHVDRGVADADHRRRRHRLRPAAWCAGACRRWARAPSSWPVMRPALSLIVYGCVLIAASLLLRRAGLIGLIETVRRRVARTPKARPP